MKKIRRFLLFLVALISWMAVPCSVMAEEEDLYSFDMEEFEKKTWEWQGDISGFLRFKTLDDASALYPIKFPDGEQRGAIDLGIRLTLNSRWDFDSSRVIVAGEAGVTRSTISTYNLDSSFISEAYWELISFSPHSFRLGKSLSRWGKGYAFNPVALMEKPKNPEDPEASREGLWSVGGVWILGPRSFFDATSLSLLFLPVAEGLNDDYRSTVTDENLFGAKLYGLIGVTDIDLYVASRLRAKEIDLGIDFATNIKPNFEIHGEWAALSAGDTTTQQLMMGFRYLTSGDVTWIAELYYNGSGLTERELTQMYQSIETQPLSKINSYISLIQQTKSLARSYGYLKASVKEPFKLLYFTPSVAWLMNLEDSSFSQVTQFAYVPVDNWSLLLTWQLMTGRDHSQYGESLIKNKLEFSVTKSF